MRAITTILALFLIVSMFCVAVQVAADCIPLGGKCQKDGSAGTCCSNFCYQQAGWKDGDCRPS
ncbi:Antimicrobial peptide 1, partial [Pseudolycoriella hygida]